ncbi:hypothetical protein [Paenibacillus dendritiformis]|uniref:hypothetical protein n=1 Tax=Paenibacillus dendritiformis TaxID=130049 RepID=UPI001BCE8BFC
MTSTAYHASPINQQKPDLLFFPFRLHPFVLFGMAKMIRLFNIFSPNVLTIALCCIFALGTSGPEWTSFTGSFQNSNFQITAFPPGRND